MAYVKTNWQTGDVITAAKLNNMETGIYDATEAAAAAFAPDIDDPQNGDVIKYDSTAEKWVNGTASGGSEMVVPTFTIASIQDQTPVLECDMTYQEVMAACQNGTCVSAKFDTGEDIMVLTLKSLKASNVAGLAFGHITVGIDVITELDIFYTTSGIEAAQTNFSNSNSEPGGGD